LVVKSTPRGPQDIPGNKSGKEISMSETTRRDLLQGAAALTAMAVTPLVPAAAAEVAQARGVFTYQHTPVALPFSPGALKGISEKLIQSHWENNYGGSVRALNAVRMRLSAALADSNTPPYVYNGLKREQLLRTGSVVLHELYFANLGGDGKAGADMRTRISGAFGTYDNWEAEFRKIAQGLGGGSGWVVLGYNRKLNLLENYWLADHGSNPADTVPLLVLDMYEHAYQMDYGAAAAQYIDAFFTNIQWDAVARRLA
jgi:Fe-Mn family superoxide dismutase